MREIYPATDGQRSSVYEPSAVIFLVIAARYFEVQGCRSFQKAG
jgi:hypothetical protein